MTAGLFHSVRPKVKGFTPVCKKWDSRQADRSVAEGGTSDFRFPFRALDLILNIVTAEMFRQEIDEAMDAFGKYIVCLDKPPEEFHRTLISLLNKAIKAYEGRGPQLRHGIALDREITVILSQNDGPRPLCGIYFNLHSPYRKPPQPKAAKPVGEPIGGGTEG